MRCYRPATREYLIERTVPNPPVIRDDNGLVSSLLPRDIDRMTSMESLTFTEEFIKYGMGE